LTIFVYDTLKRGSYFIFQTKLKKSYPGVMLFISSFQHFNFECFERLDITVSSCTALVSKH